MEWEVPVQILRGLKSDVVGTLACRKGAGAGGKGMGFQGEDGCRKQDETHRGHG